ncbi:hypothetical protein [Pseudonocardia sp. HH130630-07]|uniref:hypothetical protein n=1 Tax=Pseudonocardia sp. HH130630-07 TaxID=1690815 RepID=UPI000814E801|nr:hypothetical protein [Pseudonocardia sp. HH130630-07]ANY09601.1 hypothetical protein AFB00_28960 [Pseudonocardia sp. HH130630-07]
MKALDIVLNLVTIVAVTVVIAYFGLQFDTGLFTILPAGITGFFLARPALQWVALTVLVLALLAKAPVGRALRRRRENRV